MRTTIKKVYLRGGGYSGPVYYVPTRKESVDMNIELNQETITDSFDGGTNVFTLTNPVKDNNIFVYFNGVLQEPDVYTVSEKTLTFNIDIPIGWKIDVVYTANR